jgi:hypothetical protein
MFERAKTVHALDRAATMIGNLFPYLETVINFSFITETKKYVYGLFVAVIAIDGRTVHRVFVLPFDGTVACTSVCMESVILSVRMICVSFSSAAADCCAVVTRKKCDILMTDDYYCMFHLLF